MVGIHNMGFAPTTTYSRCFWNYLGTGGFTGEAHLTNAPKPYSPKCATNANTMLTASWTFENPLAEILPSVLIRTGDGCEDGNGYSAGRSIKSDKPFRYHYFDNYLLPQYQDKSKKKDAKNPHEYNVEARWILRMVEEGKIRDMSFPNQ